jgi:hypothetical protein
MLIEKSPAATRMRDTLFAAWHMAPYGEMYTYEAISELIEGSAKQYRHIILEVGKRLEMDARRALQCVRGEGYRIAYPKDHLLLGRKRHTRSKRQLDNAVRVLQATETVSLSPEEKRRADAYLLLLYHHRDVLRSVREVTKQAHKNVELMLDERVEEAIARIVALENRSK